MANYRFISTAFWTDAKIVDDFTPEDRYLYLYCMSNPHTSLSGCYEISIKQIASETGYSMDAVTKILQRLDETHKVLRYSSSIVALFDQMTSEHAWYPECAKNVHYFDGWKTNQVHKINSKVILPINGLFSSYSWQRDEFNSSKAESTISDIEKVFDYLDGNMTAPVDLHAVIQAAKATGATKNIQCKYFSVTIYKKGTMHLKFNNQRLVDRFNIYCCQKKGWLPPSYGKASYTDMDAEAKAVVDSFDGDGKEGSGAEKYNQVIREASYYLGEPTRTVLALGAGA